MIHYKVVYKYKKSSYVGQARQAWEFLFKYSPVTHWIIPRKNFLPALARRFFYSKIIDVDVEPISLDNFSTPTKQTACQGT